MNLDEIRKNMVFIKGSLIELYGVELLEYHNKNWLSGDNQTRSMETQNLLKQTIESIEIVISKIEGE